MSILTWITGKELEREIKKTKETDFVVRKTGKFYSGGEETRNASGHQGKNERQLKKKMNRTTYDTFSIHKTCN